MTIDLVPENVSKVNLVRDATARAIGRWRTPPHLLNSPPRGLVRSNRPRTVDNFIVNPKHSIKIVDELVFGLGLVKATESSL